MKREVIVQAMSSDTKRAPFESVKEPASPDDENTDSQDRGVEHEGTQLEQTHQCEG
jgi:hypothetical protein